MPTIPEALAMAVQHHQAGRLEMAERAYREILQTEPNHAEALHLLGVIAHQAGRNELALQYIEQAIASNGAVADFHYNLAKVQQALSRFPEAVANYRRAVGLKPDFAGAHNNLGNALREIGRLEEASASFRRALELKPDYPVAHNNLGNCLLDQGKVAEAVASYRRTLEIQPSFFEACNNLGLALEGLGELKEATACFRQAVNLAPSFAEAHLHLGSVLAEQGEYEESLVCLRRALALKPSLPEEQDVLGTTFAKRGELQKAQTCFRQALALAPDLVEAHNNLGLTYDLQGKAEEAIGCFRRALELQPDFAEAHNNLGNVLMENGKLEAADACFRRAQELNPEFAEAHNNLGNALKETGRLEDAVACFQRALGLNPSLAETHNNLGNAYRELRMFQESFAQFHYALELDPDYAEVHYNLGMARLQTGSYQEGWRECEHRLACSKIRRVFPAPRWRGERVEGGSIFIHGEQGIGDAIQFIRYAPLVRRHAGARRVILETRPALARLFTYNRGCDLEIFTEPTAAGAALPPFDCYIPLMSLPLALGRYEPLPMADPYIVADPQLRQNWRDRLGVARGVRVGLVWAGNPGYKGDRFRSIEPNRFLPLLQTRGFEFYSLQVNPGGGGKAQGDAGLIDLTQHLADFADTAALLAELDLIISVDTAVAHLAGAMGRPVWTLLPVAADWRWGTEGDSTTWYPTMRLFRQTKRGDWDSVLARVEHELAELRENPSLLRGQRSHQSLARGSEAIACCRRVVELTPDSAQAHLSLGAALLQQEEMEEAVECYRRSIALQPGSAEAHCHLGIAYKRQGKLDEAIRCYRRAVELQPDLFEAHNNMGNVCKAQGKLQEALVCFRRALDLRPDSAEAHLNLGDVLTAQGRLEEAIACNRRTVELKPDLAEAHHNLGNALSAQGNVEESIASYRRAVTLNPDYALAYRNLGNACRIQGDLDQAGAWFRQALILDPDCADTHNHISLVLKEQGRIEESIASVRRALTLQPDFSIAHHNLGIYLLLAGRYEEGWNEYEHRLECAEERRKSSRPRWNGERVEGRTILIQWEQGYGDVLQFARYVPLVRDRAGAERVILETHPQMARLFNESGGMNADVVSRLTVDEALLPEHDYFVPLMSLPHALGLFEPLPVPREYLVADPVRRRDWRERLGLSSKARVGLAWAGSATHHEDRLRSIPPATLLPLLQRPEFEFYSLQVGPQGRQIQSLEEQGLIDLTTQIVDFADTAALIAELDLIITVDTAVAHLAGAMGRPVWTLLSFVPDWRWGMQGESTPWYPTMRLFRQPKRGDWDSVLERVDNELARLQ